MSASASGSGGGLFDPAATLERARGEALRLGAAEVPDAFVGELEAAYEEAVRQALAVQAFSERSVTARRLARRFVPRFARPALRRVVVHLEALRRQ